ncbi:CE1759 family FMN reductase [Nigerium massiliense]|uniref:CE1759 family FMN reductase n=1 Tax=Nigerium massiliense TaxID=1522317 RepID=UPI00058D5B38|nr:CE1759 family FMN reductase [Nigerium massiliense]
MSHIAVVTAGTSNPSSTQLLGERLGEAVTTALGEPVELRSVEIRTLAADLVNRQLTHVPSKALTEAFETLATAAGVIAVTPIWNASYSGLFKMFFDSLDEGVMARRPVLVAATGGTQRHSLAIDHALVPLFFYLKATVSPTSVFAATADWGDAESGLDTRIRRAAADFAELVRARPGQDAADEFADFVDFSELLHR